VLQATLLAWAGCAVGVTAQAEDGRGATAFRGGGEFVLFSNDAWHSLGRSTLDGELGEDMYKAAPGKKVAIQMVDGGQRYFYFEAVPGRDDRVTLYDTGMLKALWTQTIPVDSDIVGPLFGKANTYLIRTFTGTTDNGTAVVVDFSQGKALRTVATGGPRESIKALPDGRLYRINGDTGRIAVAASNGQWSPLGTLAIPAGRKIGTFDISHKGDRIALYYSFVDENGTVRGDIWVANIDGSGQYRLTAQGDMFTPRWSPDDSRIAFQHDTLFTLVGAGLGGAGVNGDCSYWQVPADSRNVAGIAQGSSHAVAKQILVNAGGIKRSSACHVLAWVQAVR
jgi:hypothetical protein